MTEQEVFNIVVKHLAAQNWERSISDNKTCAYRGLNGKKCAIGALLLDDEVPKEGATVHGRWFRPILERLGLYTSDLGFLDQLQCAHDLSGLGSRSSMEEELKQIGARFRLEWPLGSD